VLIVSHLWEGPKRSSQVLYIQNSLRSQEGARSPIVCPMTAAISSGDERRWGSVSSTASASWALPLGFGSRGSLSSKPPEKEDVQVSWMWQDAGFATNLNRRVGLYWRRPQNLSQVIAELRTIAEADGEDRHRRIRLHIKSSVPEVMPPFQGERELAFVNAAEAVAALEGAADVVLDRVDEFRRSRASTCRAEAFDGRWPPTSKSEDCLQCIDCGSPAGTHCSVCGLVLCTQPKVSGPRCLLWSCKTAGTRSTDNLQVCRRCVEYADTRAIARTLLRKTVAEVFRGALSAKNLAFAVSRSLPPKEEAPDCAGCAQLFDTITPGRRRHHCRACGRSLCSQCFCGSVTCMGSPLTCPHKATLMFYGGTQPEKVCRDCLPAVKLYQFTRSAVSTLVDTATKYAQHSERVSEYFRSPAEFPLYKQEYSDSATQKVVRAGTLAVTGAKLLTPFLSLPYAMGVQVAHAAWNYGQYGILGLFLSNEILEGLQTLRRMGTVLENIDPGAMVIGALYLLAESRFAARSDPDALHREANSLGKPVRPELLTLLVELEVLAIRAPYEHTAFEVQRLAMQQRWRLVTENLLEGGKHKPAWCLFIHQEQDLVAISIRGTDPEKSYGGDVLTDMNALPEKVEGCDGQVMVAHSGMLASARTLERELRPTIRQAAARGFRVVLLGHSLGGGIAACLLWLLHHGAGGERLDRRSQVLGVGFGTPSMVDQQTSVNMRDIFVTVVNSLDIVPRLTLSTIQELASQIERTAKDSVHELDEDVQAYVDRVMTVWEPRNRSGTAEVPGVAPEHARDFMRSSTLSSLVRLPFKNVMPSADSSNAVTGDADAAVAALAAAALNGAAPGEENEVAEAASAAPMPGAGAESGNDASESSKMLECAEGDTLWIPGGRDSVHLAWFGDARRPWQQNQLHGGVGAEVTEALKEAILQSSNNTIFVSSKVFGDPCPKARKKLFVLVSNRAGIDLFCPGLVVNIYRRNGSLLAAEVPCDTPSLRRIVVDKRVIEDHRSMSYHRALQTVRARMSVSKEVQWQSFADAGSYCPCCHSIYEWRSTARSRKSRSLCMTNCRACGRVVCEACASTRQAMPELGILDPARICDSCTWRGPEGSAALSGIGQIFAAASSR